MEDLYELSEIRFGVMSPEEIERMSVCDVTDSSYKPDKPSVYNNRMGFNTSSRGVCATCALSYKDCPGHMGSITLHTPIFNPIFFSKTVLYMQIFCKNPDCLKPVMHLEDLKKIAHLGVKEIATKSANLNICSQCSSQHHKITGDSKNLTISVKKDSTEFSAKWVYNNFFRKIKPEFIRMLGVDPDMTHPKNFIFKHFPVMPPCARPGVQDIGGNDSDDDLTWKLCEIVRINNSLYELAASNNAEEIQAYNKEFDKLKQSIVQYYNGSSKQQRNTNGRITNGLCDRLKGKHGRIRKNIMGKRVDHSARSVISPDSSLKFGELGVPYRVAMSLTTTDTVSALNKKNLEDLVNNDMADTYSRQNRLIKIKNARYESISTGDLIYKDEKDSNPFKVKNADCVYYGKMDLRSITEARECSKITLEKGMLVKKTDRDEKIPVVKDIQLQIGDVVNRYLQDGDYVLLNRQPTLHKGSMIAFKVKVKDKDSDSKTFSFNLATTKTFNADFDGDEMNIHVPQSYKTKAELKLLCAAENIIVSEQNSTPNISIVQDSLVSAFIMSIKDRPFEESHFNDIASAVTIQGKSLDAAFIQNKIKMFRKVYAEHKQYADPEDPYTTRLLLSLLFPDDFDYQRKCHVLEDCTVRIKKGILYQGCLDKASLGSSSESIIQRLNNYYSKEIAAEFITNIQLVTNRFMTHYGFSIGYSDCFPEDPSIFSKIEKDTDMYLEKANKMESTLEREYKEHKILITLQNASENSKKHVLKGMNMDNNSFLTAVTAGSKGDAYNLGQTTGSLGQQHLRSGRVRKMLDGKRSLPHYPKDEKQMSLRDKFVSRGFILSSLSKGLTPQEFFFYAMAGREDICSKALGTASSGYLQRRLVKLMEDLQVMYDGTVRDSNGDIIQFSYGDNSIGCDKYARVDGKLEIMDVSVIADMLNNQVENKETLK